jgi:hypothetical protein
MDRRQQLIAQLGDYAARLGRTHVSCKEFTRATGVNGGTFLRYFDSWGDLCRHAGVQPFARNVRASDDDIFAAMRDAFLALGGVPAQHRFWRAFRYSSTMLYTRGWKWREAKARFRRWVEANDPAFPYLDQLPAPPPARPAAEAAASAEAADAGDGEPDGSAAAPAGLPAGAPAKAGPPPDPARLMGEFIDFPGFAHAPANEAGVVLLFGMLARSLGFVVERVGPAFPDCEAKRRVAGGRWQRLRIEFEYRAASFLDHGHDPDGCDLIVCWHHNWPDCPIPVLDLKQLVRDLARRRAEERAG